MVKNKQKGLFPEKHALAVRITYVVLVLILTALSCGVIALLQTKEYAFKMANPTFSTETENVLSAAFPIGVNPLQEVIIEDPIVDDYVRTHLGREVDDESEELSWLGHAVSRLAKLDWYQSLASPISRILVIEPGERREQVVDNFGDILRWDKAERATFETLITSTAPELIEGKFFPGHYVFDKDASPETVATALIDAFTTNIEERYTDDVAALVPLDDALTLASLLEREAYDFEDMRYISGVIWNRLFISMNLQIDASLQYAKGSKPSEPWWPVVRPRDKYIESPYNTYENEGLPPAPIANPSVAAIVAALNPRETNCLFYFHDSEGGFHCAPTYEEHVRLLKEYYGQGR